MHLTINLGLNNTINLIWDHYEGFTFSTYRIYRYSNDEWEKLDSISNNLTSYTDLTPPYGDIFYMIEITNPFGCEATKAVNKNTSRSNVSKTNNPKTGIDDGDYQGDVHQLSLYPNPNTGSFYLSAKFSRSMKARVMIYNILGHSVYIDAWDGVPGISTKEINLEKIPGGIYFIKVITQGQSVVKPFIIQ